jgi:hypothetical protein
MCTRSPWRLGVPVLQIPQPLAVPKGRSEWAAHVSIGSEEYQRSVSGSDLKQLKSMRPKRA